MRGEIGEIEGSLAAFSEDGSPYKDFLKYVDLDEVYWMVEVVKKHADLDEAVKATRNKIPRTREEQEALEEWKRSLDEQRKLLNSIYGEVTK